MAHLKSMDLPERADREPVHGQEAAPPLAKSRW